MRKETSRDFQSSVDTIVRVFVVSKKEDMFLEWNLEAPSVRWEILTHEYWTKHDW